MGFSLSLDIGLSISRMNQNTVKARRKWNFSIRAGVW